ncbi:MAG TPA: hypothetical protein VMU54_17590, partial [Planctomycetota bacterium]|nr:hypothetical protein [Planctomycetota bacterium]
PSDIPAYAPLALRIRGAAQWTPNGSRAVRDSLNFFDQLSILSGGTLGESNSFFLELAVEGSNVSFTPRLNFEALFQEDTESGKWLNLSVGFVGDHEIDLPELQDAQKVGPVTYLKSAWTTPVPGTITDASGTSWSPVTTSGFVLGPQAGLMFYGYQSRFKYAVGLVNGEQGLPDRNSRKDGFLQFSYKLGGRGLDGKGGPTGDGKTKEELSSSPAGSWVDDSLTLGFFGYLGSGRVDAVNTANGATESRNDHYGRWGMDARWKIQDFTFTGGFLLGRDNNPYGVAAEGAIRSTEYLLEGKWFAYPWLVPLLRFEYLNLKAPQGVVGSDIDGTGLGLVDSTGYVLGRTNTIERLVLEANILYRANIKISPFAIFYLANDLRTHADLAVKNDTLIGVGVDFAF